MATSNALPHEFEQSYLELTAFPRNHIEAKSYGDAILKGYHERLSDGERLMFLQDEDKIKVPIRDISADGSVTKVNVLNDDQLKDLLGHVPQDPMQNLVNGSNRPLAQVSIRVQKDFLDFICLYGSSDTEDNGLRFSGFKSAKVLKNPTPAMCIPQMDRSGRAFQLCYNLKVTRWGEVDNTMSWTIEQYAVYHRFDVGTGVQVWMIGDPHAEIKERVGEMFRERGAHQSKFDTIDHALGSSLETHLALAAWVTSQWKRAVLDLGKIIHDLNLEIAYIEATFDRENQSSATLGEVQKWEDKTNETAIIMAFNVNVLKLFREFYKGLVHDENFPNRERWACQQEVHKFASQVDEVIDEAEMLASMATGLAKVFIQFLQGQTAAVAYELNIKMFEQANQSATEAIAMRIITVVTLIYLPATFSSTFFSTDIVKYQDGESFSWLALTRFMQVTVPLMFLTFLIAGGWFWVESKKRSSPTRSSEKRDSTDE
ncbi:hypothetical protein CABS01_10027 [Colletotrichum abscissum]|uniref:CorA-like transporter domain-containing protein n=1 Tax=Colletotrichum abscissum TaxID=1671311 RepID=A0A9P9X706_9PEZI|nr:uncharacterized protein CABS01_10027 [Colletotrichum abscissum]KAI3539958.1 hypothetical protein CABS02_11212 [Colletotrichum abscissum]KAK1500303.1 hypothetical protein CABS01_10027 [Colletotrichum abscissum]